MNITYKQAKNILLSIELIKKGVDGNDTFDYTHIFYKEDGKFEIIVGNHDDFSDVKLFLWDDTSFEYSITDSGNLYIKCNDDDPSEAWELTLVCYGKINLLTIVNTLV